MSISVMSPSDVLPSCIFAAVGNEASVTPFELSQELPQDSLVLVYSRHPSLFSSLESASLFSQLLLFFLLVLLWGSQPQASFVVDSLVPEAPVPVPAVGQLFSRSE